MGSLVCYIETESLWWCSIDSDNDGVYDTPLEIGDVDGDGKIAIDDATEVLKYYAKKAAGLSAGQVGLNTTYPLSLNTADINGDKKIDISDATLILEMYAKKAADIKWIIYQCR